MQIRHLAPFANLPRLPLHVVYVNTFLGRTSFRHMC